MTPYDADGTCRTLLQQVPPEAAPEGVDRSTVDRGGLAALTPRERSVLAAVVEGRSNQQIARRLYISDKTVSVHVTHILAKLGVRSRVQAALLAQQADHDNLDGPDPVEPVSSHTPLQKDPQS